MIEARHLTRRYGQTVAVDEASFAVRPGRVTGFLGPNGAGCGRVAARQAALVFGSMVW